MFVVALSPSMSHYYFFIYLPCKKYRSSKSKLTYISKPWYRVLYMPRILTEACNGRLTLSRQLHTYNELLNISSPKICFNETETLDILCDIFWHVNRHTENTYSHLHTLSNMTRYVLLDWLASISALIKLNDCIFGRLTVTYLLLMCATLKWKTNK